MCGIFGIINLSNRLEAKSFNIPNATDVLKHRGPDDSGYHLDENVYLAQRRLSIIDLDTGKQPIYNEESTVCIVFNGEIYNFLELRRELKNFGHIFSTKTDTEVIVHAYEQWGKECVSRFRGMFAFALWDKIKRCLLIARDRLGIKPLFYSIHNGFFYFASEMKAIIQYSFIPREIDNDAVAAYFCLSYIPCPLTIFRSVKKLEPGYMMEVTEASIKVTQYWDLCFHTEENKSERYFIEKLTALLEESTRLRMVSDVPIGAFLSGGIDSGAIVANMSRLNNNPILTFTMGFGGHIGGHMDERGYAEQVAKKYNTNHTIGEVQPNVQEIIKDIACSFDEPFADPSTIPSYYLYQIARQNVTVALSGLGGDEVFGGYERYIGFKLSSIYNYFPPYLRKSILQKVIDRIPERSDGHYTINHLKRFIRSASEPIDNRYFKIVSMLPGKYSFSLFNDSEKYMEGFSFCQGYFRDLFMTPNADNPIDKIFYTDLKTYLPDDILACTDRMSMRHSLEVRVPFIDHKFLEFCATIPSRMKIRFYQKKYILKKALKEILPPEVINHRKQGFVGPMTQWLRSDLRNFCIDTLSTKNLEKTDIFNTRTVDNVLSDHFKNKEQNDKLIWALVMFQKWYEIYIDNQA